MEDPFIDHGDVTTLLEIDWSQSDKHCARLTAPSVAIIFTGLPRAGKFFPLLILDQDTSGNRVIGSWDPRTSFSNGFIPGASPTGRRRDIYPFLFKDLTFHGGISPNHLPFNPNFDPSTLLNNTFFRDSSDATSFTLENTDRVAAWADKATNGWGLTASGLLRPTLVPNVRNSLPGVYFDGSNFLRMVNATPGDLINTEEPFAYWWFGKQDPYPGTDYAGRFLSISDQNNEFINWVFEDFLHSRSDCIGFGSASESPNWSNLAYSPAGPDEFHDWIWIYNGLGSHDPANYSAYKDGLQVALSEALGDQQGSGLYQGMGSGDPANPVLSFKGYILADAAYKGRTIDSAEVAALHNWRIGKWG